MKTHQFKTVMGGMSYIATWTKNYRSAKWMVTFHIEHFEKIICYAVVNDFGDLVEVTTA